MGHARLAGTILIACHLLLPGTPVAQEIGVEQHPRQDDPKPSTVTR